MNSMRVTVRLICIAVTAWVVAPVSAQTGAWTTPVVLSTGGQGWAAAAAIDGDGNSLALWDERTTQDQLWSVSKASGGQLGLGNGGISGPRDHLGLSSPAYSSTAGFATAVWSDSNGVWTADRPSGSKWDAAQLLIPGASNPIFVTNSRGMPP